MKTKEEIEKLAFLEYPRLINDPYNPMEDDNAYERQIWIDAYTQCQEDMADLLKFRCKQTGGHYYFKVTDESQMDWVVTKEKR